MSVGNVHECSTRGLLTTPADGLSSSLQLHALKPGSREYRMNAIITQSRRQNSALLEPVVSRGAVNLYARDNWLAKSRVHCICFAEL